MIRLPQDGCEIAAELPSLPSVLRAKLSSADTIAGVLIDEDDRDQIVEAAADELLQSGFDADYKPTTRGSALEDLITQLTSVEEH
jgi:hypothetical protein